ncbi:MAG: hypothetical protein ACOCVF_00065 [bacterium]
MKGLAEILLGAGIILWILFACNIIPIFIPLAVNVGQVIHIIWLKTKYD